MKPAISVLCFGFLSVLIASTAFGRILNVPDSVQTIQAAINDTQDGDTVLVQPGRYVENIDFNGHNIVVGSLYLTTGDTTYVERTVIDGDSSDTVVQIASGETNQAELVGLTVTRGGLQWLGGGFFIRDSSPTLRRLLICDNHTGNGHGAGAYVDRDSQPVFADCIFEENTGGYGSGLWAADGCSVTVIRSLIRRNIAERDGAGVVCIDPGTNIDLSDVVITENIALDGSGGGLSVLSSGSITGTRVSIASNRANSGMGGAAYVYFENPSLLLMDSEVIDNYADRSGGAFALEYSANLNLINTVVIGNSADLYGGAIYAHEDCRLILIQSAICLNESRDWGSAIRMSRRCTLTMDGVTITDNHSPDPDYSIYLQESCELVILNSILHRTTGYEITAPRVEEINSVSISYSEIRGGRDGIDDNHNIAITWGDGNIDSDPLFVNLDNGDYHLTENSPCIDAGDPDSPPDPDGTRTDMGAFYFEQNVPRPVILIEPDSLDFGVIRSGDRLTDTLTIHNFGGEPLTVTSLSITDEEAFLIEEGAEPFELASGEKHIAVISFTSNDTGAFRSSFRVASNDPARPVVDVPLTGKVILMLPDIAVSADTLLFDRIDPGQQQERTLVLRNVGNRVLNIPSLFVLPGNGPFRIISGAEVFEIEPDSAWTLTIRFTPQSFADFEAHLMIESDDPDESAVDVALLGTTLSVPSDNFPFSIFHLHSAFPNPFNNSTAITFSLDREQPVRLEARDLHGRIVATLFAGKGSTGENRVVWDASGVPTGVYLLRLVGQSEVSCLKVALVR